MNELIKHKDLITNIIGLLIFLYEPVRAYLEREPFRWQTFLPLILMSIVAWYTGKQKQQDQAVKGEDQ